MYHRIKQYLLSQIESGDLKVGDRIPAEEQLAEQFAVSRMTARHAVLELVNEGRLYRRQGTGTFVTEPRIERQLTRLTTLSEELEQRGHYGKLQSRVLAWKRMPAAPAVAEAFGLPAGDPVLRISRIRYTDGTPIAMQFLYLPADLVGGLQPSDVEGRSLYRIFEERFRLPIQRAEQRIEAVPAPRFQARWLEVTAGVPLLLVRRKTYLSTGAVMEIARTYYRSDRYHFQMTLYRGRD